MTLLKRGVQKLDLIRRNFKINRAYVKNQRSIYHFHIRKTAGTSINYAFLENSGVEPFEFYTSLTEEKRHEIVANEKIFLAWNTRLINQNKFHFAFSHSPFDDLTLSEEVFKFTCLRDPVKRVLSHYNMLQYFKLNNVNHVCRKVEEPWLGNSFSDFLDNIPKSHLQNQLFMFSKKFDINEAVKVLKSMDFVLRTESLEKNLEELSAELNWPLKLYKARNYGYKSKVSEQELTRLKEMLLPEYEFLEKAGFSYE